MGKSTIASIVHETCRVLWAELVPIHMPIPTEQRLKAIAEDFEATWNFPHCIGAIDGKHCEIKKPPKSGSAHWCYKKRNSIVMQAVADAKRRFVAVEVGGRGKQSDGGTFIASTLYKLIEKNKYKIPRPKRLPNSDVIAPYVLVGDEAYPLKHYLMRPYPERVPQTENDWIAIAKGFEKRWNFPHCLGSLDGKHIDIIPPANSGSFFFNYKHRHSLVLLAIADANYKFILFDFGTNGRVSDGGVLQNTEFFRRLQAKLLNIPGEKEVANESRKLPFVFVADDAFPLRPDMLKPYRQSDLTCIEKKLQLLIIESTENRGERLWDYGSTL
ncbi:unnamed protein product [Acanthoscelides obtectus]|uniref:DDE Tnp4 domain-containing protein n=1 Tax=Acanthoscelides obtectus TaxID=200917 RepID=A0A9P0KDB7_ACAOB|nr:unnamed protein product [Acanthoscelides obtectus]CAK1647619.1 Protein ANTAGONIST OF LIKE HETEROCHROMATIN PROTEIN 1 [Acanthoscelides obtectus]